MTKQAHFSLITYQTTLSNEAHLANYVLPTPPSYEVPLITDYQITDYQLTTV